MCTIDILTALLFFLRGRGGGRQSVNHKAEINLLGFFYAHAFVMECVAGMDSLHNTRYRTTLLIHCGILTTLLIHCTNYMVFHKIQKVDVCSVFNPHNDHFAAQFDEDHAHRSQFHHLTTVVFCITSLIPVDYFMGLFFCYAPF